MAALVDGIEGLVVAPDGALRAVIRLTVERVRIVAIDVIADPGRLAALTLGVDRRRIGPWSPPAGGSVGQQ